MASQSSFDVVVIGSGSAGFSAAIAAHEAGASVCLIEKEKLGGECPNWACVPTKALLKSAKVYRQAREAETYGVSTSASFDFSRVMDYRRRVVESITGGGDVGDRYLRFVKKLQIHLETGQAVFVDSHAVSVNDKTIRGKAFVIATGTLEFVPPVPGLADVSYLTFKSAVMVERQPKSLAIIGGGPVGCELATFFSAFGTRVVLFQTAPTILNREDPEIAALAQKTLSAAGVEVFGNAKISEVLKARGGVYGMTVDVEGEVRTHAVDQIVLAAGKRANTNGLNVSAGGVVLDQRGNIKSDARQRTSARHVFAAGDVDGGMLFTHTAHNEGNIAGHNAALTALGKRTGFMESDERVVPRVTFVDPEVASVGMTAPEAKEKFGSALVGRARIAALGRAATEHAGGGLVKIVAHPKTRKVLGCHIQAPRAGELIHEAALAIHLNATVDALASMIHAYPTYSEAVMVAAGSVQLEK